MNNEPKRAAANYTDEQLMDMALLTQADVAEARAHLLQLARQFGLLLDAEQATDGEVVPPGQQ